MRTRIKMRKNIIFTIDFELLIKTKSLLSHKKEIKIEKLYEINFSLHLFQLNRIV